jgi:hypothetical protein
MFRYRGAAAAAGALGLATFMVAAPAVAQVDDEDAGSYAEGRFLSGTMLDADLATTVDVDAATAVNDGSVRVAEEVNPFSVTALDSATVDPGTVEVTSRDGADVGVIGQYAIARDDGTSYASSGLVGPNGAIGVSPAPGNTAVVDLGALLGDALPSALDGLRLEAAGIAAEAEASLGDVRGDYTLADARLAIDIPVLATADDRAVAAMLPIEASLRDLGAPGGELAGVVDRLLATLGLGGLADIGVSVDVDLDGIVDAITDVVLTDQAISIDLGSGTVTVDLAARPDGTGLNDQAVGTELLTDGVVSDIVDGVERLLDGYLGDIDVLLANALRDTAVHVGAHASLLEGVQTGEAARETITPVTQILNAVTGEVLGILGADGAVTSLVPGISADLLADLLVGGDPGDLGGLLGGAFGGSGSNLPDVTTQVVTQVSTSLEPTFSTVETSADVVVDATLGELLRGAPIVADVDALVLGAPVALDASIVVDGLADAVSDALPGGIGGVVDDVADAMLDPIVADVTGDGQDLDGGIGGIAGLVSLRTNVQSTGSDGAFTQTALRVEVLDGSLATVNLANATVGPNAAGPGTTGPVTPGTTTPGGPGGGTGGGTGGGATGGPFGAEGDLAFTGLVLDMIAILGALLLGLGALAIWRSRRGAFGEEEAEVPLT